MNLSQSIIESCQEIFPMFGLEPEFKGEQTLENLNSNNPVNILIGMSHGIRGNLVIGMSNQAATGLVSQMLGGAEISTIDLMAKSALGELTNMLIGNTFIKISSEMVIELSPPTIIIGEDVFLLISNTTCQQLSFGFAGHELNIAYSIG